MNHAAIVFSTCLISCPVCSIVQIRDHATPGTERTIINSHAANSKKRGQKMNYKITFKNGIEKVIATENPVNLREILTDKPAIIGNAIGNVWINAAEVLTIEEYEFGKSWKIKDCSTCRYEGLTYCMDCFNNDLYASKD